MRTNSGFPNRDLLQQTLAQAIAALSASSIAEEIDGRTVPGIEDDAIGRPARRECMER